MSSSRLFFRYAFIAGTSAMFWAATTATALAKNLQPAEPQEKSYVMPYILVILTVGLGLMLVLRSVNRTTDVKDKSD